MSEEQVVKDPDGLLAAYERLKEDIRRISAERDELTKAKTALEQAAADNEWRNRALAAEVKSALTGKGLKDVERLMPLLGTEGIDFDDTGAVTGIDERLATASKEYPELFDAKRRAGGRADAFAGEVAETKSDPFRDAIHNALTN
jgi:hypothetical protein